MIMQSDINEDFSKSKKGNAQEETQAESHSEIREGQGNSSIREDEKENTETPYPNKSREDTQYKSQEEYIEKKPNKTAGE